MVNRNNIILLTTSEDERNIFVPRGVAEVSPYIKKEVHNKISEGN